MFPHTALPPALTLQDTDECWQAEWMAEVGHVMGANSGRVVGLLGQALGNGREDGLPLPFGSGWPNPVYTHVCAIHRFPTGSQLLQPVHMLHPSTHTVHLPVLAATDRLDPGRGPWAQVSLGITWLELRV